MAYITLVFQKNFFGCFNKLDYMLALVWNLLLETDVGVNTKIRLIVLELLPGIRMCMLNISNIHILYPWKQRTTEVKLGIVL